MKVAVTGFGIQVVDWGAGDEVECDAVDVGVREEAASAWGQHTRKGLLWHLK